MTFSAFTEHPASVGESYFEHQQVALGFAWRLIGAGLACAVHAFAPWLFVETGSRTILDLHRRLSSRRAAAIGPGAATGSEAAAGPPRLAA